MRRIPRARRYGNSATRAAVPPPGQRCAGVEYQNVVSRLDHNSEALADVDCCECPAIRRRALRAAERDGSQHRKRGQSQAVLRQQQGGEQQEPGACDERRGLCGRGPARRGPF